MQNTHTSGSIRRLALDGIFTAVLVILGMIKLPSLIPGAEFQLSAPMRSAWPPRWDLNATWESASVPARSSFSWGRTPCGTC